MLESDDITLLTIERLDSDWVTNSVLQDLVCVGLYSSAQMTEKCLEYAKEMERIV